LPKGSNITGYDTLSVHCENEESSALKKDPRRFLGSDAESSLPRLMASFCRIALAPPHTAQHAHSAHALQKEFLKSDQYYPVGTSGAPVAAQPLRITLAHTLVVNKNEH